MHRCLRLFALLLLTSVILGSEPPVSVWAREALSADEYRRQGELFFRNGNFEKAVGPFHAAATALEAEGRGSAQVEALYRLALSEQALGRFPKSLETLRGLLPLALKSAPPDAAALVLASLAYAQYETGAVGEAEASMAEALSRARSGGNPETLARVLATRARVDLDRGRYPESIAAYEEGLALLGDAQPLLAANLSSRLASALLKSGSAPAARGRLRFALDRYTTLPDSHEKAEGLVLVGQGYRQPAFRSGPSASEHARLAETALTRAMTTARSIGDLRCLSYAAGYLAQLREEAGNEEEALLLTRRASFAAQEINAHEILYLWEWQAGRLLKARGQTKEAVSSYRNALSSLQTVRVELASGNCRSCAPSGFQRSIQPVYYELADLLLREAAATRHKEEVESLLREARDTIELLKAAELQDYFQDPCVVEAKPKAAGSWAVAGNSAVVYSITFPDRLDLLMSLGGTMKLLSVPVSAADLWREAHSLRLNLEKRTTWHFLPHAQKLYDWIVRPLEKEADFRKVGILVFIPDGVLRTIPLGALHDGEHFLMERLAVVNTPGLSFMEAYPSRRENLRVLAGGITEGIQGYCPLNSVKVELDGIQGLYKATRLENRNFLKATVGENLKAMPYTVVHIATHGEFASTVSDTYLLSWDGKINMDQLAQWMKQSRFRKTPVELLSLSACQTAVGDDRAALGLAGIAIRAGAGSALATLWNVNDEAASALVVEFYRLLRDPKVSKTTALQQAQLKLLRSNHYAHPYYWSPFLLIGNWL